jgi:hypothetical protein
MSFKINNLEIPTQPTQARWLPRNQIGVDGNGHTIYSGVREFEMRWQLLDPETSWQLQTWYSAIGNSGTFVVDLPYYMSGTSVYRSYTGCVLREPEFGPYFVGHSQEVLLLVTKIITE